MRRVGPRRIRRAAEFRIRVIETTVRKRRRCEPWPVRVVPV